MALELLELILGLPLKCYIRRNLKNKINHCHRQSASHGYQSFREQPPVFNQRCVHRGKRRLLHGLGGGRRLALQHLR